MKKVELNARLFRILLILLLVVTIGLMTTGFSYVFAQLKTFATETNELAIKNSTSAAALSNLRSTDTYLKVHNEDVMLAKDIVSSEEGYAYQDDFVKELTQLAKRSNVDITQFTFPEPAGTGQAAAGTSGAAATPPAQTPAATPTPTTTGAAASALKSISCNITLKSPLPYKDFVTFLKLIELNPKRMQVTSISLSGSAAGSTSDDSDSSAPAPPVSSDSVTTETLEIKVYLK